MMLLLESALRSLLLGLLVWTVLKLVRMRDTGTETIIWTVVLIIALSMPLLSRHMPGLHLAIPHLWAGAAATVHEPLSTSHQPAPMRAWLGRHGQFLLLAAYSLGLLACLLRRITGLVLTLRLYLRATPVAADWTRGRTVRASAALRSPASLAGIILLPADYPGWSAIKREAVLAHEEAHIARGDFFVQLAASMHCAVFWFSPFAWWLQSKLADIAETASDAAAVRHLNDRVTYAEILLEVARCARPAPLIVGMAKGPLIQQRIDRILSEAPNRNLSLPLRVLVMAVLTVTAFTVASARAAPDAYSSPAIGARSAPVEAARSPAPAAQAPLAKAAAAAARIRIIHPTPLARRTAAPPQDPEAVSYDPRALLDPVYSASRPYVPASTIVHAGQTFYIRSTERAVAAVSDADGTYRPAQ
jgi:beta-lactamase regulating signal transducer with metallopeptidase domain